MEGQKSAQDGERAIGQAEAVLGLGEVPEDAPFVGGGVFRTSFRGRLRCHHGER